MFKGNSKNPNIRCGICWKLTRKTLERLADVVQLLLTWNVSDILFYCFCCWLWAGKYQLSEQHSKYVCVCVCLYPFACWLLPIARRLWHTWDVRISDLLSWVFLRDSASFFMSISKSIIFHLQRWKLQPTATGEKTKWYKAFHEEMI